MARKSFLLRIDEKILDDVRRMADSELRSLNGQIEYLLRAALKERGRLGKEDEEESKTEL
jgi:hypothetical protein